MPDHHTWTGILGAEPKGKVAESVFKTRMWRRPETIFQQSLNLKSLNQASDQKLGHRGENFV